ncbi:MAG: tRNA pseudouridine(38-40) synthase TruA [bacterium]
MRNIKLTLEYDGTRFHGWQKQGPGVRTVQGVLEGTWKEMMGENIRTVAAGRTDAGVHALGQVVNFFTNSSIPTDRIAIALNSKLPSDLVVRGAEDAGLGFHARFSARSRRYRYLILNSEYPSALEHRRALWVPRPLDIEAMGEGSGYLIGEHDFSSFANSGGDGGGAVRNLISLECFKEGDRVIIEAEADSFLYSMVRVIVGVLVRIGSGRIPPKEALRILEAKNRLAAFETAAPWGLYLVEVKY